MKRNRIPALLLAMLLTLSLSVSAFAAGSTTATVPVTLTVDNQYRAVNVQCCRVDIRTENAVVSAVFAVERLRSCLAPNLLRHARPLLRAERAVHARCAV